ncbi:MAG: MFS transporter [Gammaproteobacteria bacterium]|nr:MFS transporter [Gammaproteobacteria bacterium]
MAVAKQAVSPAPSGSKKLAWTERIGYGVGDLGSNMVWGMTTAFLLFFYTDVFGITASAAGTLFVVARVFDAINDPIMGMVTERIQTRWGKFRHYLLFGAPILGIVLVLTFSAPELSNSGKLVYAYVTYIVLGVVYTATNLPYGALATTMTKDPSERNSLSALRSLGALLGGGLIVGVATPSLVETFGGGNSARGFQMVSIIYAIIGWSCLWITFASSKERYVAAKTNKVSFGQLLGIVKSNTPFLLLAVSVLLMVSGAFIRIGSPVFYMTYYLNQPQLLGAIMGLGVLGMVTGLFISQFLAGKLGKRNIFIFGLAVMVIGGMAQFFTPYSAIGLIFFCYLSGSIGLGFCFAVMWSMISDTVEYSEWKSGIRAEGGIYSGASFVMKLSSAVAGGVPALILAQTGYVPNVPQSQAVLDGINWMLTLVPALFALVGIVPMLFYRLDETLYAQIVADLDARKRAS